MMHRFSCPHHLQQLGTAPIFYTATDTVTDLVNTEHVGNRQQDAMMPSIRSCLMHPVNRFDTEGCVSCN